jgi:hypothetical protein
MMASALIMGPEQEAALAALRELATRHPVAMPELLRQLKTPRGKRLHMAQMTRQSIWIPTAFLVTFSIETQHPAGTCRHMSVSSDVPGRLPSPEAVWMIAATLGFVGGLNLCKFWIEELDRGQHTGQTEAVNLVQPLSIDREGGTA